MLDEATQGVSFVWEHGSTKLLKFHIMVGSIICGKEIEPT